MGDSFPISNSGHVCNSNGKIITYRRERTYPEYEVIVKATTLASTVTLGRVARSILKNKRARCKDKSRCCNWSRSYSIRIAS